MAKTKNARRGQKTTTDALQEQIGGSGPNPGGGAVNSVTGSNGISVNPTSGDVIVRARVSGKSDNILQVDNAGDLYVPAQGGSGGEVVESIEASDNSLTISPETGHARARVKVSSTSGNAVRVLNDGLYVPQQEIDPAQPTHVASGSLDVSQTGYNATVEIKEQDTTSAVRQNAGKFDVKVDNATIVKSSSSGQLSAVGGGSSTGGQPTSINSNSLDVKQNGYQVDINLKQQGTSEAIEIEADGTLDVKVDDVTIQKDSLGRLKALPAAGKVDHGRTLTGDGDGIGQPLQVRYSADAGNIAGNGADGGVYVPKQDPGMLQVLTASRTALSGHGIAGDPLDIVPSSDPGNTLVKGSDFKLYVPASTGGSGQPTDISSPTNTVKVGGRPSDYARTVDVNISGDSGNALTTKADGGLFVPTATSGGIPTGIDSPVGTISVSGSDYDKHIDVRISPAADNGLELRNGGLFAPKSTSTGLKVGDTLTGDGATTALNVAISEDADSILKTDSSGKLKVPAASVSAGNNGIAIAASPSGGSAIGLKLSSEQGNAASIKSDGLFVDEATITSHNLDIQETATGKTINIKQQQGASAIDLNYDGNMDVKVDNTTIVKSAAGVLSAVGGGTGGDGKPTDITSPSSTITVGGSGYDRTVDLNAQLREKINNVTNPTGYGIESKSTNGNIGIKLHDATPAHINTNGELVIDAIQREHYYYSPQLSQGSGQIPASINQFYDIETGRIVDDNQEIREGSLVADVERRVLVVTRSLTTTPNGSISISRPLQNVSGPYDITTDTATHTERAISVIGDAFHPVLRINIDPRSDNALSLGNQGLYVPHDDAGSSQPTDITSPNHTVDVGGSGFSRTVQVAKSANPGNTLQIVADGLFVPAVADKVVGFADITGQPSENTNLKNVLADKVSLADNHDIPVGGVTGQVLKKKSASNYDVEWGEEEINVDYSLKGTGHSDAALGVKISSKAGNQLQQDGTAGLFVPQAESGGIATISSPSGTITITDVDAKNKNIDLNAQIRDKINNVTNPMGGGIKSTNSNGNIGLNIANNTALHLNSSGQLVNDAISRERYYYSPQLSQASSSIPSSINQFYDVETSQKVDDNQTIREGSLVADVERRVLVVTRSETTTPSGNISISRPLQNVSGPYDINVDTSTHSERALSIIGDSFHPTIRVNVDPNPNNALTLTNQGLFVPHEDAGTGNPTDVQSPKHSITVGGSGFTRTIDVAISASPNNQARLEADGVFVPAQQVAPPSFAEITGNPTDNQNLSDVLANKMNKSENHDIPNGGLTGNILAKNSENNYDVGWIDANDLKTVNTDNRTITGNSFANPLALKVASTEGNQLQVTDAGVFVPPAPDAVATDVTSSTLTVGGSGFSRTVDLTQSTQGQLASISKKLEVVNVDYTLEGDGTGLNPLGVKIIQEDDNILDAKDDGVYAALVMANDSCLDGFGSQKQPLSVKINPQSSQDYPNIITKTENGLAAVIHRDSNVFTGAGTATNQLGIRISSDTGNGLEIRTNGLYAQKGSTPDSDYGTW